MLIQYTFTLCPQHPIHITPEMGYRLYGSLLNELPEEFGNRLHKNQINPVSQYIVAESNGYAKWHLSIAGDWLVETAVPLLDNAQAFSIRHGRDSWQILQRETNCYMEAEEILAAALYADRIWTLSFVTPTAFKRQGLVVCLPEIRLILQSLIRKWNVCFPECPIEDEDGEGITTLSQGLHCTDFRLETASFHLKTGLIRGFTGELTLANHLDGLYGQLINALMLFSKFTGIGIKTTLGMGGVQLGK